MLQVLSSTNNIFLKSTISCFSIKGSSVLIAHVVHNVRHVFFHKIDIQNANTTFESLNFNPFIANDSLNDNSQDPDVNFFHDNVSPLDTHHIPPDNFSGNFNSQSYISILGVFIKTLNLLQNSTNH